MSPASPSKKSRVIARIGRWSRRFFLLVVALLIVAVASGATYQAIAAHNDQKRLTPLGEMVDIGTHRLHLHCMGSGSPTVVLDAGAQLWSSSWQWVQSELARTTRVCAHDRAGLGWSEAGPGPYDGKQAAFELHNLLDAADIERPFIYVGHSLGTLLGQIYDARYPEELAGMVFVDWRPPDALIGEFEAERNQEIKSCGMKCNMIAMAARLGVVRIMLERNEYLKDERLPEDAVAEFKAISCRPEQLLAALAVSRYVPSYLFDALDAGSLDDLPLLVLYSSEMGSLFAQFDSEEERAAWFDHELLAEQVDATQLSTRSRGPISVDGANHLSVIAYKEHAAEVSSEIAQLVRDLRAANSEL